MIHIWYFYKGERYKHMKNIYNVCDIHVRVVNNLPAKREVDEHIVNDVGQ